MLISLTDEVIYKGELRRMCNKRDYAPPNRGVCGVQVSLFGKHRLGSTGSDEGHLAAPERGKQAAVASLGRKIS